MSGSPIADDVQRLIDLALSIDDRENDVLEFDGEVLDFYRFTSRLGDDLDAAIAIYERYGAPECSDRDRHFAADVIAGPNDAKERTPEEIRVRTDALLEMLRDDETDDVVSAVASGLGRLDDERAPAVLWSLRNHPSWWVRWSLTFGAGRHYPAEHCVDLLIHLTRDADERVRDWAAHWLGHEVDVDTAEVRAALAELLDDDDPAARHEAIHALAVRRDPRAVDSLMRDMDQLVRLLEMTPTDDRWLAEADEIPNIAEAEESAWHLAAETGDERFARLLMASWRDADAEGDIPPLLREAVVAVFGADAPPATGPGAAIE